MDEDIAKHFSLIRNVMNGNTKTIITMLAKLDKKHDELLKISKSNQNSIDELIKHVRGLPA